MTWWAVGAVSATCFALRAGVPLFLRARALPDAVQARLNAAVLPVLAALVALQVFTRSGDAVVDARAAGIAAAATAVLARRSLTVSLAAAAVVTALVRST